MTRTHALHNDPAARPGGARPPGDASSTRSAGARARAERRLEAAAYVEAAVALGRPGSDAEQVRTLGHRAATALVRLAELGTATVLAETLRPDPDESEVTWTVACYQIGDLVPCALRDFGDPVQAVRALETCPEASHVAAELLASTASGLRWSALVRTGKQVVYQAPTPESASCAATTSPDTLRGALDAWSDRLARWAAMAASGRPDGGLLGDGPAGGARSDRDGANDGPADGTEELLLEILSALGAIDARMRAGEDLLERVEARLSDLEQRLARAVSRPGGGPAC